MKQAVTPIIVGSTSPHKLAAVRLACRKGMCRVQISEFNATSGQNAQPVGFAETYAGALTRATQAKQQHPGSIAIGIESGIFRFFSRTFDMAVIVVLPIDCHDCSQGIITTSTAYEFPEEFVHEAEKRGFATTTVGSIITEKCGGDKGDPHAALSNGKITRTNTLVHALKFALKQAGL